MFLAEIQRGANRLRVLLLLSAMLFQVLFTTQATMAYTQNSVSTNALTSSMNSAPFNYILSIVMENQGICGIIPNIVCSSLNVPAPYLSSLAVAGGLATNYTAISHPSLPNYLALFSGEDWGCTTDAPPKSNACTKTAWNSTNSNLVDRLEASGLTWKAYMEDMPFNCDFISAGNYTARHDPFVYFNDIVSDPTRCNRVIPAGINDSALTLDLSSVSTASNFMWLSPNMCNDMHGYSGCTNGCISGNTSATCITDGDLYLSQLVPKILGSYLFTTQQAALFITFDEGSDYCPASVNRSRDCVYSVWIGPATRTSHHSAAATYSHYSYLSTIEAAWTLQPLTSNDTLAAPMSEFFTNPFPPVFNLDPSSPEIGQQVTLTAFSSSGAPPYSFSWSLGDGSSSTANPLTHTYLATGQFNVTVVITDANLTTAEYSRTITVAARPEVSFIFGPIPPEAGWMTTFSAITIGGVGPFSFDWTFGDGGSATGGQTTYTYLAPGIFTANVTATDSNGYNATWSQTIFVATPLSLNFTESVSSFRVNQAVTFIASAIGGVGAINLTWDFGDGSTESGSIVTHTYTSPGNYTVVLTGNDLGSPHQVVTSHHLIFVESTPTGSPNRPADQPCLASLCFSKNIWIIAITGAIVLGLGSLARSAKRRSRRTK